MPVLSDAEILARIDEYTTQVVEAAPPLSDSQKARLRELLRPVGGAR
ncbi:hypothetical protein ACWDTP_04550 [Mycobacterium sp. NPDC003449]